MYSVRSIISIEGSSDPTSFYSFGNSIFFNPIYADVIAALKERPGFIRKTTALVEDKETLFVLNETLFDSKENCEAYWNDPSIVNLWGYFDMYAAESGAKLTHEISDKNLNI